MAKGGTMKRSFFSQSAAAALLLAVAGCSSQAPTAKKEPPKPPEPVSALSGITYMYQVARQWAPDAKILQAENAPIAEVKSEPGKFGAWRCTFVSESRRVKRSYSYSVVQSEGLNKGVFGGAEETYLPNPRKLSFFIQDVKVDSIAALETASKELADMIKKNPDVPANFILEWDVQSIGPAWRVFWGPSVSQSIGSGFVDVKAGKFLRKQR
jgi:hypothetical protein